MEKLDGRFIWAAQLRLLCPDFTILRFLLKKLAWLPAVMATFIVSWLMHEFSIIPDRGLMCEVRSSYIGERAAVRMCSSMAIAYQLTTHKNREFTHVKHMMFIGGNMAISYEMGWRATCVASSACLI